mmetsp:Transcript_11493/g.18405  ORF Transcript_11493/g.18405 Transcript_11493/m.18405 type:complete len:880 (+) Transcript_11493:191-2830(+)
MLSYHSHIQSNQRHQIATTISNNRMDNQEDLYVKGFSRKDRNLNQYPSTKGQHNFCYGSDFQRLQSMSKSRKSCRISPGVVVSLPSNLPERSISAPPTELIHALKPSLAETQGNSAKGGVINLSRQFQGLALTPSSTPINSEIYSSSGSPSPITRLTAPVAERMVKLEIGSNSRPQPFCSSAGKLERFSSFSKVNDRCQNSDAISQHSPLLKQMRRSFEEAAADSTFSQGSIFDMKQQQQQQQQQYQKWPSPRIGSGRDCSSLFRVTSNHALESKRHSRSSFFRSENEQNETFSNRQSHSHGDASSFNIETSRRASFSLNRFGSSGNTTSLSPSYGMMTMRRTNMKSASPVTSMSYSHHQQSPPPLQYQHDQQHALNEAAHMREGTNQGENTNYRVYTKRKEKAERYRGGQFGDGGEGRRNGSSRGYKMRRRKPKNGKKSDRSHHRLHDDHKSSSCSNRHRNRHRKQQQQQRDHHHHSGGSPKGGGRSCSGGRSRRGGGGMVEISTIGKIVSKCMHVRWVEEFGTAKTAHVTLEDVVNRPQMLVDLAMDQYGSRLIQQKLEKAPSSHKEAVFQQVVSSSRNFFDLCTDVFGNYVIQKLFELGTQQHKYQLAQRLKGHILDLSLHTYGCRVIQKAIDVLNNADNHQKAKLVEELYGHVMKCVQDQNGNHVIQKCIEKVPPSNIQFVVEAVQKDIMSLAMHPYGCRVIQRLLEYCSTKQNHAILSEILQSIQMLAKNQYGNYVVQYVLIHANAKHRATVIKSLKGNLVELSKHKFSSNVMEKCVTHAGREERKDLMIEMLGDGEELNSACVPLMAMAKDQYANYVVQKLIEALDSEQRQYFIQRIQIHLPHLSKLPYGKHIIATIETVMVKRVAQNATFCG